MQLRFSPLALDDLDEIYAYLSNISPKLLNRFCDEIDTAVQLLQLFPYSVRLISKTTRIKILHDFPYLVIYQTTDDFVIVLRVVHQRSDYQ